MINPELDLTLLAVLRTKEIYKKYISLVDVHSLSEEAKTIMAGYSVWFEKNEELDLSEFTPWFLNTYSRISATSIPQTQYKHILSRLYDIDESSIEPVLMGLKYRKCGEYILKKLGVKELLEDQIVSLKSFDSNQIETVLHEFNKKLNLDTDVYTDDFGAIYEQNKSTIIKSSVTRLNEIIRGYKDDFFHMVVAGTDAGKTAFCISEAVAASSQIDPDDTVLFFTNEQSPKMVKQRVISCILNKHNKIFTEFEKDIMAYTKQAEEKFNEAGGNKIKIINIFGKPLYEIKKYCDKFEPKLIIIDQLDNLIHGKTLDGSPRPYNEMYKRIRSEIAQVYAPVIGTTQAKNRGKYWSERDKCEYYKENVCSGDVHWSNVDKQANVDVIIGLSVLNRDHSLRHIIVDRHKEGLMGDCYAQLLDNKSKFIDIK